jgi:inhibitor of KinA sporulation pathway (predicted exonuclease)
MKALRRAIKDRRVLVFIDLEGTQFTSEIIEFGAYMAFLNDDLTIARFDKGFTTYVKATNPIGRVVTEMTGITESLIKKKGVSFPEAMTLFQKYLRKNRANCIYVTFGNHDIRMLNQSVYYSGDASKDFVREMQKNYLDFSAFLSTYVKDEHGNPYSLSNYLKIFNVDFDGKPHDALADALNLMDLYKAMLANPDIMKEEYKKVLARMRHLPTPIAQVVSELNDGKTVGPKEWETAVKDALK